MSEFLWEIAVEEIPARMLPGAIATFGKLFEEALKELELGFERVESHGTPRRLMLSVAGLADKQADRSEERRGPPVKASFAPDGSPTKAAEGFAKGCGVTVEELQRLDTPKGEYLAYTIQQPGKAAVEVLPEAMDKTFNGLPWPKSMRWGDGETRFVRPVQGFCALLNGQTLAFEVEGVTSGDTVQGHRFMNARGPHKVSGVTHYKATLADNRVMLNLHERMEAIRDGAKACAAEAGGEAVLDEGLISENASLTEWPIPLLGAFDPVYLEIPPEVLTTSMKSHQKYFPVVDAQGRLLPHFIAVANMLTPDQSVLVKGYQRVLKARLEDAAFYWNEDRKTPLTDRLSELHQVVWQAGLGSLFQKSQRMGVLGASIANAVDSAVAGVAERAGLYGKCDLVTGMVFEFPELQGVMGGYYLPRNQPEDEAVALAISEHYMPAGANDDLPTTPAGRAVSIADKLDTLVGCFGMGITPSGAKDPFGLRRAALGIIRMLLDGDGVRLSLRAACREAYQLYAEIGLKRGEAETIDDLLNFFYGRLQAYLKADGLEYDLIDAVQALGLDDLFDVAQRVRALDGFRSEPAYQSLVAANKRIGNILDKAGIDRAQLPAVNPSLFLDAEESGLFEALSNVAPKVSQCVADGAYADAMGHLAGLRETVDLFFDKVMVMADDEAVRANRQALLAGVSAAFFQVADISCLVVAE
ncbi:glycine--tRNA ligase subunit beta [Magnetofaba australis]|uniref:Glycine--tRNA ligase beta subunit n=1 Tax=Magnetofaba australis IT-1 TaxID=1434232 RepID=A0A1Y2K837_9PROT|nr:glycine--tRNA ligase subunit beta [Magnetofaba australis]OSM04836.1 putative glycine--tRNA ligase [Magnetofaba australis IT-1]